jgi:DNA-binding NarL/FixJ family response regulator
MDSKRTKSPSSGTGLGPSLLIIEDHPLVAKGVVALFTSQPGLPEVSVESSLELGISRLNEQAGTRPFDLVLLDLGLPGHSGLSAFWSFREQCPVVPVAVFSGQDDPRLMRQLLKGGAKAFIPKSLAPEQILGAVRLVLAGGVFVPMETLESDRPEPTVSDPHAPPALTQDIDGEASHSSNAEKIDPLLETILAMPPRRRAVLHLIADGYSNKEICRAHDVSLNTVKTHVTLIFGTLMVSSRHELMMLLMQHHLLPKLRNPSALDLAEVPGSPKSGRPGAPRHSAWPLQ